MDKFNGQMKGLLICTFERELASLEMPLGFIGKPGFDSLFCFCQINIRGSTRLETSVSDIAFFDTKSSYLPFGQGHLLVPVDDQQNISNSNIEVDSLKFLRPCIFCSSLTVSSNLDSWLLFRLSVCRPVKCRIE